MAETTIQKSSVGVHKNVKVLAVPVFIVEFTDKEDGQRKAKLAVQIGDDIRFISDEAVSNPVAPWLSSSIIEAIKKV